MKNENVLKTRSRTITMAGAWRAYIKAVVASLLVRQTKIYEKLKVCRVKGAN